jgi:hypothetical protein
MISAALGLIFILITWDVVLSGEFTVRRSFTKPDAFVSELVPHERVEAGEQSVVVKREPVYTTLRYPRPFKDLQLTVEFKNPSGLLIEAGPQVASVEAYQLQALDHPQLDKVFKQPEIWTASEHAVDAGGASSRLYQRRSDYVYKTVEQFFAGLPNQQNVGYYGTDWKVLYKPLVSARSPRSVIAVPLRGSHEFWLAVGKGDHDISLAVQDINHAVGADAVALTLYDSIGNLVGRDYLADDGDATENGPTSSTRTLAINESLPEGVYRLVIDTSDDVFIQKIDTSAPYIVAKQRVHIAGGPEYEAEFGTTAAQSLRLYTSAREWTGMTPHHSNTQSIHIGTEALSIDEPLKEYTYRLGKARTFLLNKGYEVQLEGGNVVLTGRGVFAFDQKQYFSPFPWYVDHNVDIDALQLQYIFTDYEAPVQQEGGVLRQTLPIDLSQVFAPEKALRIQFAAPELEGGQQIELIRAEAHYRADPVTWSNAAEKFKRFWRREILKK